MVYMQFIFACYVEKEEKVIYVQGMQHAQIYGIRRYRTNYCHCAFALPCVLCV